MSGEDPFEVSVTVGVTSCRGVLKNFKTVCSVQDATVYQRVLDFSGTRGIRELFGLRFSAA
jgi:hypothetical protein